MLERVPAQAGTVAAAAPVSRNPVWGRDSLWAQVGSVRGRSDTIKIHMTPLSFETIVDSGDASLFDVRSKAAGPQGSLPITAEMLLNRPSGDLFGWAQNAGMGWKPQ